MNIWFGSKSSDRSFRKRLFIFIEIAALAGTASGGEVGKGELKAGYETIN